MRCEREVQQENGRTVLVYAALNPRKKHLHAAH
jgi:hypothetical protein